MPSSFRFATRSLLWLTPCRLVLAWYTNTSAAPSRGRVPEAMAGEAELEEAAEGLSK